MLRGSEILVLSCVSLLHAIVHCQTYDLLFDDMADFSGYSTNEPQCSGKTESTTLKLLTMLPYRDSQLTEYNPSWDQGLDILPALDLAAEQINNRSDILPRHKLELVHVDGGCDIVPKTSVGIFNGLFNESHGQVVGAVGPGCSVSSVAMSKVANADAIEIVVLHDAGTPQLADRARFKNSLGILGSSEEFANLSLALMRKTSWKNIAILYESTRLYYRSATDMFTSRIETNEELPEVDIKFKAAVFKMFYPLDEVRNSLARIVFLFTSPEHSRRILCLAYHKGLVYPGYQWVLASRRLDDFSGDISFPYDGKIYSCTREVLLKVSLNYAFIMNYQLSEEQTPHVVKPLVNTTFSEFIQLYHDKINNHNSENPNNTIAPTYWAYNMYDAVWIWAEVLHKLTSQHSDLTFSYNNKTLANMILEEFYSVDFQGMSGNITFNRNNGFINRRTDLYQLQEGKECYVTSTIGSDTLEFQEGSYVAIPDIVTRVGYPHRALVGFFVTLQILEAFVVVMLHAFTIIYRKSKSVKASSTRLSHFVFVGIYLLLIATFVLAAYEINDYSNRNGGIICNVVWVWLLPLSFTLIVGTVAVRTWRIYRIFIHYLNPGRCISTQALILIIMGLLATDLSIAVLWTSIDPLQQKPVQFTVDNGPANELMLDRMCMSRILDGLLWTVVVHLYKILLILFVVMLTLFTRNIQNHTFATSSLRIFSYIFSFIYVTGFATFYLVIVGTHNPNADYATISLMLNTVLWLIIACIALPPLLPVAKEIFKKGQQHCSQNKTNTLFNNS